MTTMEDILAEYADGLVDGSLTPTDIIKRHPFVAGTEMEALLLLAAELETVLVKVAPSPQFIKQLRHDLIQDPPDNLLQRLRHLSALQIGGLAAGIGGITVATAGVIWLANRSRRLKTTEMATAFVS